jgi:type VI secretion system FHA domain protein
VILTLELTESTGARPSEPSHVFDEEGGTIGRASTNAWVLPHNKVSGLHARITFRSGVFYIEDTSRNGVCVNSPDNRLVRNRPYALKTGDRLFIEPYEVGIWIDDSGQRARPMPSDPFADDDPFAAPRAASPAALGRDAILPESPVPGEVDPLKFFDPVGGPPARKRPEVPMDDAVGLGQHYQPPAIQPPPTPPGPPPAAPPAVAIPDGYNPLADDPFEPIAPPPTPPPPVRPRPGDSGVLRRKRDASGGDPQRPPSGSIPVPRSLVSTEPAVAPSATPAIPQPLAAPAPAARAPILPDPVAPSAAAIPVAPIPVAPIPLAPAPVATPPVAPPVVAAPPVAPSRVAPTPVAPTPVVPLPVQVAPAAPRGAQPPAMAAPAAPPRAANVAPSIAGGRSELAELLIGAGIPDAVVTPELTRNVGQILKVVVAGLMDVLQSRQRLKEEFRMQQTIFRPADNNPLKFSVNVEDALHNLLVKRNPAYLGAVDAFADAFDDLRDHQLAMLAGMRVAFDAMLAASDPEKLQEQFDSQLGKSSLALVPAKLRYWDLYRARRAEFARDPEAAFERLFGEGFRKAYEEQFRQLKAQRRARAAHDAPDPDSERS